MVLPFLKICRLQFNIKSIKRFCILSILAIIILSLFSCKEKRKPDDYNGIANGNELIHDITKTPEIRPIDELKNHKRGDSVVLLEGKIIFDENFNPSLSAELKNNMKTGIIALEIVIDPNETNKEECEKIIVKRKISIPSGKTASFKERIYSKFKNDCSKIEDARIYLGDFVLKNGKKTNSHDLELDEFVKNIKVY